MTTTLRLVFCGTPAYAVPTLRALVAAGHTVSLVLSQPDKPVGRDALVAPTPVKAAALDLGLPVAQPATLKRNEDLRAQLEALAPDAIVVVAYGRILPQWMLDLPRLGCINAHGSLLPRWRGAAPIQWAIASGDAETGVTTMQMDAGLDTGAMLLHRAVPIGPHTDSPQLFTQLSDGQCRACRRDAGSTGAGLTQGNAAGSGARNTGAAAHTRRRPHRLVAPCGGDRPALPRLPTLAGRIHPPARQKTPRAHHDPRRRRTRHAPRQHRRAAWNPRGLLRRRLRPAPRRTDGGQKTHARSRLPPRLPTQNRRTPRKVSQG